MRAERLLSVLMLLGARGRLTAREIASELEVSERTVLRDIDSLSASGVPVYAERGRHGGFALVPGYRTDLSGLTLDESIAILTGNGRLDSPAAASAKRKLAASLPAVHRGPVDAASMRVLVRAEGFVRAPQRLDALAPVQQAVFAGRRIRVAYARPGAEARERLLDPIGLIVAGDTWYLLANADGAERMYRMSRMSDVEILDEPARRDDAVDLEAAWERHRSAFRDSIERIPVEIRCPTEAADAVRGLFRNHAEIDDVADGRARLRVRVDVPSTEFAIRVLWSACVDHGCEVIGPEWLRSQIRTRAEAVAGTHR